MVLGAGLGARAQEPIVRPSVAFELASVKPNKTTNGSWGFWVPDRGNVSFPDVRILSLLFYAFDISHHSHIRNDPGWLSSEFFDIRAIPPEGVPRDQGPLMVRSLLMDRFRLRAHWEIRDQPVFSLELARQDGQLGPDLKPSQHNCFEWGGKGDDPNAPRDYKGRPLCPTGMRVAGQYALAGSWSTVFEGLALNAEVIGGLGRPVVDNTGLSGNFDLHVEFRNELGGLPSTLTEYNKPSVREAVQQQLGLKLVPKIAPWKVLVIDSIERPPPD
jgi:uncharacterized protein (TIGR03435 family)